MGSWDSTSFGNDTAVDWTYGLPDGGLEYIEAALDAAVNVPDGTTIDATTAEEAVAAAEVIARALGRPGVRDSYSETADAWVESHDGKLPEALIQKARATLDRVLTAPSELLALWAESHSEDEWLGEIENLKARLKR